jgi:hypothetical protein
MSNFELPTGLGRGHCRLCGSADVKVFYQGIEMATPVPYPLKGDMRHCVRFRRCGNGVDCK